MKGSSTVPSVNKSCGGRKGVSVNPTWRMCGAQCRPSTVASRPDGWAAWSLWCSQTVHTEWWGKGPEEVNEEKRRRRRKGKWRECGERRRDGGGVNCVYSAAMEKSMFFSLLFGICSCASYCLVYLQISRSWPHSMSCSVVWTGKDALKSICY